MLRGFVTAPTGQLLTPDGGQYAATFTTTLDSSWEPEHLHVVGFLTKNMVRVTAGDLLDMDIINATSVPIDEELIVSIASARQPADNGTTACYSLDGRRLSVGKGSNGQTKKGIFIINGKKVISH